MATPRKNIRAYIVANGASTEGALVEDSVLKGSPPDRVEAVIKQMTANGNLIKTGNDYSLPV